MHIMDTTSMLLVASSDKEFLHPYIFEFLLLSRSTRVVCGSASVCLNGLQNFLVLSALNKQKQNDVPPSVAAAKCRVDLCPSSCGFAAASYCFPTTCNSAGGYTHAHASCPAAWGLPGGHCRAIDSARRQRSRRTRQSILTSPLAPLLTQPPPLPRGSPQEPPGYCAMSSSRSAAGQEACAWV